MYPTFSIVALHTFSEMACLLHSLLETNANGPAEHFGSVALLSHFDKVLALSKFALLKCEIEVNPIARNPWVTSTAQIEIAQFW